ncbi:hypothetical protein HD806DRAFT_480439 [Xylariaceae sp. AK1471]|nr:hypothetical protein HD806DRAFT_480439 [Xylariaceae sp. AK1471]
MDERSISETVISKMIISAPTPTPPPISKAADPILPPTPPQSENASRVRIEILPSSAVADEPLMAALTSLVNGVYRVADAGIYNAEFERMSPGEIPELVRAGQLAAAFLLPLTDNGSDINAINTNNTSPANHTIINGIRGNAKHSSYQGNLIGCVCVKQISPTTGEFGMLVLDPSYRGSGLGRDLVRFAEERCRRDLKLSTMRLELLVPLHFEHAGKMRLQAWYTRMGYVMTQLRDFSEAYPQLHRLLSGPTEYRVFEKSLLA